MKPLEIQPQCPSCGAGIGEAHIPGCSVERCGLCGIQMLQDRCNYKYFGIDLTNEEEDWRYVYHNGLTDEMAEIYEQYLQPFLLKWDGVWPGVRECREYNLWTKWTSQGWQECDADDPDAQEDLNTLAMRARWDKLHKRYVIMGKEGKA